MNNKKIAIIVGGRGYLGKSIVARLVESGFFVVSIDRDSDISGKDDQFIRNIIADVADEECVKAIAVEINQEFGLPQVLIYAASAPLVRRDVLSNSIEEFELQFIVNVFGAFNFFRHFCPLLEERGSIIGITTKAIEKGYSSVSGSYIPAKCALRGLLKVLSYELIHKFVRVYALSPSFMNGGLNSDIPETVRQFITKKSAPEDVTTPEEVADSLMKLVYDVDGVFAGKSVVVPSNTTSDL